MRSLCIVRYRMENTPESRTPENFVKNFGRAIQKNFNLVINFENLLFVLFLSTAKKVLTKAHLWFI